MRQAIRCNLGPWQIRWLALSAFCSLAPIGSPIIAEEGRPNQLPHAKASHESRPRIAVQGAILKTIESTSVAAQVSGIIAELDVKEGTVLSAGQALGKIKDEAVRLRLMQLESQVQLAQKKQSNDINERLARKAKEVADNEYQRALRANALVPDTYPLNEIDRLRLVADQAELEVERARYDQDIAKFEVELAVSDYRQTHELQQRHQIDSPVGGVVVSVEKRVGEWVEPGTDLLRIVRIDQLRIEGFLPAPDALPSLVGQPALIDIVGDDAKQVTATVVFVSPDVNPVNSQVRVFLEVDNSDGQLRPGLRVNAFIEPAR